MRCPTIGCTGSLRCHTTRETRHLILRYRKCPKCGLKGKTTERKLEPPPGGTFRRRGA